MQKMKLTARGIACAMLAAVSLTVIGCTEDMLGPTRGHVTDPEKDWVECPDVVPQTQRGCSGYAGDDQLPPEPKEEEPCPAGAWFDDRVDMCVRGIPEMLCIQIYPYPLSCLEDLDGNPLDKQFVDPPIKIDTVVTVCPDGYVSDGRKCERKVEKLCPAGAYYNEKTGECYVTGLKPEMMVGLSTDNTTADFDLGQLRATDAVIGASLRLGRINDSRCPIDPLAKCVWEGNAEVSLYLAIENGKLDYNRYEFTLNTSPNAGETSFAAEGFEFTLVDVSPYPYTTADKSAVTVGSDVKKVMISIKPKN